MTDVKRIQQIAEKYHSGFDLNRTEQATLLDVLRAKESAHEKTREALRKEEQAHIATMAELDEARAQLAQAQKEIEHANLRLTRDADRLADEVDALIRLRIIDSRSPAADALLDFRDPPSTPRSCRLAEVEKQLAQAERDKAALREGLNLYRDAFPSEDRNCAYAREIAVWERDHRAAWLEHKRCDIKPKNRES